MRLTFSGGGNAALGKNSLLLNTTGSSNTAIGQLALSSNTSGNSNTGVGNYAGIGNSNGDFNTALGANTLFTEHIDNASVLGYFASTSASNTIRIGNANILSINGAVDFSVVSDERFKTRIKKDVPGLDFITRLEPVTYHVDAHKYEDWQANTAGHRIEADWENKYLIEKIRFTGFIAQDVEKVSQEIGYDFSGVDKPQNDQSTYALRYATFVVPLVKATQELHEDLRQKTKEIQNLKSEIRDQKLMNERLQNELDELRAMMEQMLGNQPQDGSPVILNQSPALDQNEPNPTNGMTRVGYFLPDGALAKSGTAQLIITAIDGKELQRITLSQKGQGQVDLQTRNLPAGTYNYSLVVDGQVVDTKRMVLQK